MTEYGYACPISVRMGDIDGNGHVNNTAYVEYFQQARASYFRELWDDDWGASSVVVATMTIDYRSPITVDDEVVVDVRVTDVGTSSWEVEYRVRADGRIAAEGSSVQVAWDREAATSQPLPDAWRGALDGELVAPDA